MRDLYDWSVRTADRVWFGTGRVVGSFTFHYLKEGKTISVFTIYTNGKLALNYGWMKTQLSRETLEGFHKKIHEIPSLQQIEADFSKWPSVKVEALIETENRENFKNAVLWLKTQINPQT